MFRKGREELKRIAINIKAVVQKTIQDNRTGAIGRFVYSIPASGRADVPTVAVAVRDLSEIVGE